MATTEELLEEMEAEMFSGENDVFVVDNNLRTVSIPESMSVLGVEHDDDVHRLYFQIPKMYGDTDLSDFDIRINYMNAAGDGDVYAVTDKEVSGDNITFSWLVGRHAFAQRGDVIFIVCLKQTDDEGNVVKEFNTTVTTLPPVLEGLETSELVIQDNPDIIEQILARLDDLEENGGGSGTPGKDGVGIDRIEKTSTQGLVDTYTIYLTDESTYTFTVTNGANGKDGNPGAKGDPGKDGVTPTIGENGNWYLGDTDTGKPSRGEKGDPGSSEITIKQMQNTDTAVTLPEETPYDLYIFPQMSELAVTIADTDQEVHFFFDSGATATVFSLQSQDGGQIYTDAYSIDANMRYEVSVLHNVAYIKGVSTSAET